MTIDPVFELSRPVRVVNLRAPKTFEVTADEEERAALARRFGLLEMKLLTASLRIEAEPGGLIRVRGRLEADISQACVVTLAPVLNHISVIVDRRFGGTEKGKGDDDDLLPYDGDDPPDPVVDGKIDIGEVVAEQLGLEIDPFPRGPGAEFNGFSTGGTTPGPFDALAGIEKKKSWK